MPKYDGEGIMSSKIVQSVDRKQIFFEVQFLIFCKGCFSLDEHYLSLKLFRWRYVVPK